jgi:hypothetical protein
MAGRRNGTVAVVRVRDRLALVTNVEENAKFSDDEA